VKKSITVLLLVALVILIGTMLMPLSAQDNTEERLADLEERVTNLEATVDAFVGCRGRGQYSHLRQDGGSVRVLDDTSTVIGTAEVTSTVATGDICLITFEAEVPDSTVYIVEVAEGDTVAYTQATMEDNNWDVSITRRFSQ
jgi:hypothetical protein